MVSELLLAELQLALSYPKLRKHIPLEKATAYVSWVRDHGTVAQDPSSPPPVVCRDPNDDYLLARDRPTRVSGHRRSGPARPGRPLPRRGAQAISDQAPPAALNRPLLTRPADGLELDASTAQPRRPPRLPVAFVTTLMHEPRLVWRRPGTCPTKGHRVGCEGQPRFWMAYSRRGNAPGVVERRSVVLCLVANVEAIAKNSLSSAHLETPEGGPAGMRGGPEACGPRLTRSVGGFAQRRVRSVAGRDRAGLGRGVGRLGGVPSWRSRGSCCACCMRC